MRETHQVRRGRCCHFNTFHEFYFPTAELIFCNHRCFRKPSKHMVSALTSALPPDNHPSRRTMSFRRPHPSSLMTSAMTPAPYTVPSELRHCDSSNARSRNLLALNRLAGVLVIVGVYTLGRCKLVGGLWRCKWRS